MGLFCTKAPEGHQKGKQQLLGVCASTQPTLLGKERMTLLRQAFILTRKASFFSPACHWRPWQDGEQLFWNRFPFSHQRGLLEHGLAYLHVDSGNPSSFQRASHWGDLQGLKRYFYTPGPKRSSLLTVSLKSQGGFVFFFPTFP